MDSVPALPAATPARAHTAPALPSVPALPLAKHALASSSALVARVSRGVHTASTAARAAMYDSRVVRALATTAGSATVQQLCDVVHVMASRASATALATQRTAARLMHRCGRQSWQLLLDISNDWMQERCEGRANAWLWWRQLVRVRVCDGGAGRCM